MDQAALLAGLKERDCVTHRLRIHDDVLQMVHLVTTDPPDGQARWTCELVAARMHEQGVPISASQVWRIFDGLDLKPWQTQSWLTSHDPQFWERAADVCGLYLDPPTNAIVWSVDEKSGMQAKSRVNPTAATAPRCCSPR